MSILKIKQEAHQAQVASTAIGFRTVITSATGEIPQPGAALAVDAAATTPGRAQGVVSVAAWDADHKHTPAVLVARRDGETLMRGGEAAAAAEPHGDTASGEYSPGSSGDSGTDTEDEDYRAPKSRRKQAQKGGAGSSGPSRSASHSHGNATVTKARASGGGGGGGPKSAGAKRGRGADATPPPSIAQGGRFSGRLPRKEDEAKLAAECELLSGLVSRGCSMRSSEGTHGFCLGGNSEQQR